MAQRLQLHSILKAILGNNNIYFQPPAGLIMSYPAIVYRRDSDYVGHAGNKPYNRRIRYQVIAINSDPDSNIPSKIAELPLCTFDRFYTADQLNHDVFNIFF
jgi:hypothetical protein